MRSSTFKFQENILHLLKKNNNTFLNNSGNSFSTTYFRNTAETGEHVLKYHNQEEFIKKNLNF